jgi:hypothetical protein
MSRIGWRRRTRAPVRIDVSPTGRARAESKDEMKTATAVLSLLLVTIFPTVAMPEQITLACKFEGSERRGPEREKDVNQLYIDTDVPAVELRIAQTMGTAKRGLFWLSQSPG